MSGFKKILLISGEFPPGPGGIGNHACNLAKYLKLNSINVTVLTVSDFVDAKADFKNKNLTPLAVYILWIFLSYSMVLLPLSETRARYSFPYILFPIFAVALIDKKNYNLSKEN